MKTLMFISLFTFAYSVSAYYNNNYQLNQDYSINFSTTRANGTLSGLAGEVLFDKENINKSYMDVTVDASTIKTGNKTKDKHARNSKWFDVKTHPTISFTSQSVSKTNKSYQVIGILSIKGISQKHTINFEIDKRNGENFLIGTTEVNRNKFNIEGNSFGFLVGDIVQIELRVPANYSKQI